MTDSFIPIVNELGLLIKKARKAKKLSGVALANLTGVHRHTIRMIEKGQIDFTISKYLTLFIELEIDPQEISNCFKSSNFK